jgi:hypothetical protein
MKRQIIQRCVALGSVATAITAALFYAAPFQQPAPPPLANNMPSGALLYLESPDFARELQDWAASPERTQWLATANYDDFSRSQLFLRLAEEWKSFGAVAGFDADLPMLQSIAGRHSALAIYDIHNLEFLYISELPEARRMQTLLWQSRAKYESRAVANIPFYVRRDGSHVVAFAAYSGYLLLATREEALAGALRLMSGEKSPAIASESWYTDAVRAAGQPGELRLVMNLEQVVKTHQFRSHWIHGNVPSLREYWAGISDVRREAAQLREDRILLRRTPQPAAAPVSVSALAAMAPADAGFYRAIPVTSAQDAVAELQRKLLPAQPAQAAYFEEVPPTPIPGNVGSESDLETRIDEPPLDRRDQFAAQPLRQVFERAGVRVLLEAQSSRPLADGVFVQLPCAIAFQASNPWDENAVQAALTSAVEDLWSTSGLGLGWVQRSRGAASWHELDGLAKLVVASRGNILVIGNSSDLVAAMLERAGSPSAAGTATYIAEFRHAREQQNYERIMQTIDQTRSGFNPFRENGPAFFSGNIAGLGQVLRRVQSAGITVEDRGDVVVQSLRYLW